MVFHLRNDVDSASTSLGALSRGLHALCVRFAAGVAPGPRNTRFRLVANLDRSGLSPAGSHRRFPSCLSVYIASPFTKLCLAQYVPSSSCSEIVLSQLEHTVRHGRGAQCDECEAGKHLPEREAAAEAVGELGKVAR